MTDASYSHPYQISPHDPLKEALDYLGRKLRFDAFGAEVSEETAGPLRFPDGLSRTELTALLAEQLQYKSELAEISQRVIATRDTSFLDEFSLPSPHEPGTVEISEDLPHPTAFINVAVAHKHSNSPLSRWAAMYKADAAKLLPGVEIREVTSTDGEKLLAYIGVDFETMRRVHVFCLLRRFAAQYAKRTAEHLAGIEYKPSSDPDGEYINAEPELAVDGKGLTAAEEEGRKPIETDGSRCARGQWTSRAIAERAGKSSNVIQ